MRSVTFERFDQSATEVIKVAFAEAAELGDGAVGTEHLLLALATADASTAKLLAAAGGPAADIRRFVAMRHQPNSGRDQAALLASLGVDLVEIRRRAEETFGAEAITRAAWRVERPRPRRPRWHWISCSKPWSMRCDSPLAGQPLVLIPRMKRLLERAANAARPQLASPRHLLLALVTVDEPAGEVLTAIGVDLRRLAEATRTEPT